jgi:hypothetical protein
LHPSTSALAMWRFVICCFLCENLCQVVFGFNTEWWKRDILVQESYATVIPAAGGYDLCLERHGRFPVDAVAY